jgi:hypothetical protein
MSTPTVTEKVVPVEPVGRDDFMGSSQSPRQFELPVQQRDLVALSLLRCPQDTDERRRS